MTVYLVLNQQKQEALQVAQQAAAILQQQGACAVWPELDPARDEAALASADAVLTIGGDGTILHTARRTQPYGIPILGINLGRVGFLATCEIEEMVLHEVADVDADLLRRLVFAVYDVRRDSHLFRQRCVDGTSFDRLRATYRERRELSTVTLRGIGGTWQAILSEMGFKCV